MLLDLIFMAILSALVAYGAWRGAVASASGLVALVAGYASALFAATHFSGWAAAALVLPSMLAPVVAGTLGFAVAFLLAGALGDVAIAWDRERIEGTARGIGDRVVGGAVGLVRGGLVVVLLAVLSSWLDAARDLGAVEGLAAMPDAGTSSAVAASEDLVEGVVARALADAGPAGQMAARIAARPGLALENVQDLLEDERLTQLFEDRLFWTLITNGSVDHAMNRAAMRSIVEDPGMRRQFAELGLVGEPAAEDPQVFRVAMAAVLAEVAPRVHRLQHDPELNELARDPEIIALVEAGDMMSLVGHPSVRKLVERVSGP
jgi:membrane protein required for colicin V production